VPDGEVGAFTFVTLDYRCVAGEALPTQALHLARAAPAGSIDVKVLHIIVRTATGEMPSIGLSYVIPHYTSAVLVPWKLTTPGGAVENHVTRH
jgi:hypothetical protein